jgi:hypothetical protein
MSFSPTANRVGTEFILLANKVAMSFIVAICD